MCAKSALAKFVDSSPELTAAALNRQAEQLGMDLSADRILTHRKHRATESETAPAKQKRDFAVMVRDKYADLMETGELDPLDRNHAAGVGAGLKAQAILDKRENQQKKHTQADMLVALLSALRGNGRPPEPVLLEDPNVIEGVAHEVSE